MKRALITTFCYTGQRRDSGMELYWYRSRWYDPEIGRFIQPDTIVPEPSNPQALNRYAYTLNNPIKYTDLGGHDPIDAFNFLFGFGAQWGAANVWFAPQAQAALAVEPNEPWPMTAGRHVAAILQGLSEVGGGGFLAAGGGAICITDVGCLAGAPAVAAGVAVAAHGGSVAITGAMQEGQMLGDIVAQVSGGEKSSTDKALEKALSDTGVVP